MTPYGPYEALVRMVAGRILRRQVESIFTLTYCGGSSGTLYRTLETVVECEETEGFVYVYLRRLDQFRNAMPVRYTVYVQAHEGLDIVTLLRSSTEVLEEYRGRYVAE